jgi:trans-aconitate methyltransferase
MSENPEINSLAWWEDYFESKWEANHGREQTRHFMERMTGALPASVRQWLTSKPASILDWGCAFGDGTDVLASSFLRATVAGYDFSARAVAAASRAYPRLQFFLAGRDSLTPPYDAVFCSNCLEHFADPIRVAAGHIRLAGLCYALLVPHNEVVPCESHRVTLTEESFPNVIGNFQKLYQARVPVEPQHWPGEQLLVIYGSSGFPDIVNGAADSSR